MEQLNEVASSFLGDLQKKGDQSLTLILELFKIKDSFTCRHQIRVSNLVEKITRLIESDTQIRNNAVMGGLFHDTGKLLFPQQYIAPQGRLFDEEFTVIKTHTTRGYQLLSQLNGFSEIANVIYQHHERLDGSGYPLGLEGEQISIPARVVGIADSIEAMSAHRPYMTKIRTPDEIIAELQKLRVTKYDPLYLDAACQLMNENKKNINRIFE